MPAAKPADTTRWGETSSNISEPALSYKQAGWLTGAQVPSGYLNWLFNRVENYLAYLRDFEQNAFTWAALQTFAARLALTDTAPSPTTSFSNPTLAGANVPIAHGLITTGASPAIVWGFNLASVATPSTYCEVTLNRSINFTSSANCKGVVLAFCGNTAQLASGFFVAANKIRITVRDTNANATVDLSATNQQFNFICYGVP